MLLLLNIYEKLQRTQMKMMKKDEKIQMTQLFPVIDRNYPITYPGPGRPFAQNPASKSPKTQPPNSMNYLF